MTLWFSKQILHETPGVRCIISTTNGLGGECTVVFESTALRGDLY